MSESMVESLAVIVVGVCVLAVSAGSGSSANLKEIFIGRCWDYQTSNYKHLTGTIGIIDCNALWTTFSGAFIYKSPCNATADDYKPYFDAISQPLGKNRALFWSGTYYSAHEYGDLGRRLVTLEDTLRGYVVNGLNWCGQEEEPGINYHECPESCDGSYVNKNYWESASQRFASEASGVVTVMVNGSRTRPAFRDESMFATVEIPNLYPLKVHEVWIFVVHDINKKKMETCGSGSVPAMIKLIKTVHPSIAVSCFDNPSRVLHMLCIDEPHSSDCTFADRKAPLIPVTGTPNSPSGYQTLSPEWIAVLLAMAFVVSIR